VISFGGENSPFLLCKKKSPKQHGQGNFLQNFFLKKSSHFDEESYEIVKRFFKHLIKFLAVFFLFKSPYLASRF